jgi:hypothetical protein
MVFYPLKRLISVFPRALLVFLAASFAAVASEPVPESWLAGIGGVSANSLRAHVSFLASDLLEGRATPSRGLDVAAEYIAAQFRRAGLEPAGDEGYFQNAKFILREPNSEGAVLRVVGETEIVQLAQAQLVASCPDPTDVPATPALKSTLGNLGKLDGQEVKNKVLIVETRHPDQVPRAFDRIRTLEPVLVVLPVSEQAMLEAARRPMIVDAENVLPANPPLIVVADQGIAQQVGRGGEMTISAKCGPQHERPVRLRNVVGLLRGSDPSLNETAIVVSAHYDHVGVAVTGEGDPIFNGANDDASGTAAVMEIASVLSTLSPKPKRSIIFAAFFGEERGMLGSRYYVRHPAISLEKTVADINLEQVGRPWPVDVPKRFRAWVTGFEYSEVVGALQHAAKLTGVELQRDQQNDDDFFPASDNISFAEKGVPAHTVCTSFFFPDYHKPGDHWDKLDYDNMAVITRMIALGALIVADSSQPPKWREGNPRTEKYRKAPGN